MLGTDCSCPQEGLDQVPWMHGRGEGIRGEGEGFPGPRAGQGTLTAKLTLLGCICVIFLIPLERHAWKNKIYTDGAKSAGLRRSEYGVHSSGRGHCFTVWQRLSRVHLLQVHGSREGLRQPSSTSLGANNEKSVKSQGSCRKKKKVLTLGYSH